MLAAGEFVVLGRVSGTHGIRGELKVHSFSDDAETLQRTSTIVLRLPGTTGETFTVTKVRNSGKKVLLTLQGFDSINQVEHLVGCEVCVTREQLPPLDEGEYYWHDLLGMSVVTTTGDSLGVVKDIFATGSNDVYVVRLGRREYMIPALDDVVVDIDLVQRVMTISPFEGLLDL